MVSLVKPFMASLPMPVMESTVTTETPIKEHPYLALYESPEVRFLKAFDDLQGALAAHRAVVAL